MLWISTLFYGRSTPFLRLFYAYLWSFFVRFTARVQDFYGRSTLLGANLRLLESILREFLVVLRVIYGRSTGLKRDSTGIYGRSGVRITGSFK